MNKLNEDMPQAARMAELLFPNVTATPADILKRYPSRGLSEGAWVSRFAPSPTGFMHIGGLYAAFIARKFAHESGGTFFLRIEDTDKKREVPNGIEEITKRIHEFDLMPDEGVVQASPAVIEQGNYGPYIQSERVDIYLTFAKDLVARGLAYPCFCSEEDLQNMRQQQEVGKVKTGYYGPWATHRDIMVQEVDEHLMRGTGFVIRLKAPYPQTDRIKLIDFVKGDVEMPENDLDAVLLKSDFLPTYHFAHAVDDSLMQANLIIRGDEWLSSVPLHVQLFRAINQPIPKFGHLAPIAKKEGASRRKLSKRKDPEAAVSFYSEQGYPTQAVLEYLLNIANPAFEGWRLANPLTPITEFKLRSEHMSVSSALFDLQKLNDISQNLIARMAANEVYDHVLAWAEQYMSSLAELLRADKSYSVGMFGIERDDPNPRKDIAHWSQVEDVYGYFFDSIFAQHVSTGYELPSLPSDRIEAVLRTALESFEHFQDKDSWLTYLRQTGETIGFARNAKAYKTEPDRYAGNFGDLMMVIRVVLTGRRTSPDLYQTISVMGKDRVTARLQRAIDLIKAR